jgi:hypothetical protein
VKAADVTELASLRRGAAGRQRRVRTGRAGTQSASERGFANLCRRPCGVVALGATAPARLHAASPRAAKSRGAAGAASCIRRGCFPPGVGWPRRLRGGDRTTARSAHRVGGTLPGAWPAGRLKTRQGERPARPRPHRPARPACATVREVSPTGSTLQH